MLLSLNDSKANIGKLKAILIAINILLVIPAFSQEGAGASMLTQNRNAFINIEGCFFSPPRTANLYGSKKLETFHSVAPEISAGYEMKFSDGFWLGASVHYGYTPYNFKFSYNDSEVGDEYSSGPTKRWTHLSYIYDNWGLGFNIEKELLLKTNCAFSFALEWGLRKYEPWITGGTYTSSRPDTLDGDLIALDLKVSRPKTSKADSFLKIRMIYSRLLKRGNVLSYVMSYNKALQDPFTGTYYMFVGFDNETHGTYIVTGNYLSMGLCYAFPNLHKRKNTEG